MKNPVSKIFRVTNRIILVAAIFLLSISLGVEEIRAADKTDNGVSGSSKYAPTKDDGEMTFTFRHSIQREPASSTTYRGVLLINWSLSAYGSEPAKSSGSQPVPIEPGGKIACPSGATVDYFERFDKKGSDYVLKSGISDSSNYCYRPFGVKVIVKNSDTNCNNASNICLGQKKEGYTDNKGVKEVKDDKFCQTLMIDSTQTTSGGASIPSKTVSSIACTNIYRPYNYSLSLKVSTSGIGSAMYPGITYKNTIKATVLNSEDKNIPGNPSSSPKDTETHIFMTSLLPNESSTGRNFSSRYLKGDINTVKADIIKNLGNIINEKSVSGKITQGGTQNVSIDDVTLNESEYPVGSKICFVAATNYTTSTKNTKSGYTDGNLPEKEWQISDATCSMVAKASKYEVHGGSTFSDGTISSLVVESGANHYGSWVDYGVISNSQIKDTASAKSLLNSTKVSSLSTEEFTKMTIANNSALGNANISHSSIRDKVIYRYTKPTTLSLAKKITSSTAVLDDPNYYTQFSSATFSELTNSENPDDKNRYTYLKNGTTSIKVSNGYELGSTSVGTSITHIVYSEGDIRISSDLKYFDGPYISTFKLPQYIIIAKGNIYIDSNVSRVDAWLVSEKTFYSCYETAGISCSDKQVQINGPILAKSVSMNRTYGVNTGSYPSSEIITLNAASYYWANAQAENYSRAISTYTRELAPRK